jgi:hypothetical protein
MSVFFKRLGLFFLFGLLIAIALVVGYKFVYHVSSKHIPAPAVSDSYSLNEKLEFLRTSRKDVAVLALGSSIALNNLHSETTAKRVQPNNFLNVSSWGMNMQDNYLLFKELYEVYHPTTLILTSSIIEFEKADKQIDYSLLKKYLTSTDLQAHFYHLKCFNLRYYMDNAKYKKHVMEDVHGYEYLVFDSNGGIMIDSTDFKIDANRWVKSFDSTALDSTSYFYLDSISTFCKNKNIKLLFFQSPFREGVYTSLSPEKSYLLKAHMDRIVAILGKGQNRLIDANKKLWSNSYFLDGSHLNAVGAKAFTEYCFNQLDSLSAIH